MPPARILDSLEREGKASDSAHGESKSARHLFGFAAVTALLAGVGGFLAFDRTGSASSAVSAAPSSQVAAIPQADNAASAARSATLSAAIAAPSEGDVPSADAARIEPTAVGAQAAAAFVPFVPVAPIGTAQEQAPARLAPRPRPTPAEKLARKNTPVAAALTKQKQKQKKEKASSGQTVAAKANARTLTAAKSGHARIDSKSATARARPRREHDADTELVAAIIAGLDRRGASRAAKAGDASTTALATPMRRCSSQGDPADARHCGDQACDGQWGKVDACPASRAPATWHDKDTHAQRD